MPQPLKLMVVYLDCRHSTRTQSVPRSAGTPVVPFQDIDLMRDFLEKFAEPRKRIQLNQLLAFRSGVKRGVLQHPGVFVE